jgi:hypothetical protein
VAVDWLIGDSVFAGIPAKEFANGETIKAGLS